MRIRLCQDQDVWNSEVVKHTDSTIFHTYEWGKLLETIQNVTFHPIIIENVGDTICCPIFMHSKAIHLGFIGYGGPLLNNQKDMDKYLEIISDYFKGSLIKKVILKPNIENLNLNPNWSFRNTYILDLKNGYDSIWTNASGKIRTGVRYAQKNSVVIHSIDNQTLKEAYIIYEAHTKRLGQETFSIDFFKKAMTLLKDKVIFKGAYLEKKLISWSLFLRDESNIYHWLHCSTDVGKKLQSNYLLYDNIIKYASHEGIKSIDMGYSHNLSIAKSKLNWGAIETPSYTLQGGNF